MHYLDRMSTVFEAQSTLTDRYQTTIPSEIRHALKLHRRDKIRFHIRHDGVVTVARASRATKGKNDPALGAFLQFLAGDIAGQPQHVQGLDKGLVNRIRSLTHGVKINLAAPLPADE